MALLVFGVLGKVKGVIGYWVYSSRSDFPSPKHKVASVINCIREVLGIALMQGVEGSRCSDDNTDEFEGVVGICVHDRFDEPWCAQECGTSSLGGDFVVGIWVFQSLDCLGCWTHGDGLDGRGNNATVGSDGCFVDMDDRGIGRFLRSQDSQTCWSDKQVFLQSYGRNGQR